MDESEHASIDDIKKLADSLKGKFETLHPLTTNCCIYRIPRRIRQLDESICTPQAVSIGPFHYGREELKAMEGYKLRYLQDFLQRTQLSIEEFLMYIKEKEVELRQCYSETIKLGSDEFVQMILVDAVFIIEVLLRSSIFMGSRFTAPSLSLMMDIWPDIFMLENQLPMFILEGLFELAKSGMSTRYVDLSLFKLTSSFFNSLYKDLLINEDHVLRANFSKAEHFLDLLCLCLEPPGLGQQHRLKTLSMPTITELHQAGLKFKLGSSKHLFDIRLKNGILEIPKLKVVAETEALFRNLQVFEQLQCNTRYLNDYIIIMNHLVNTRRDVELLIKNGVLENWLCDSKDLAVLFRNLVNQTIIKGDSFYYSDLVERLNAYSSTPWHKWKATLKQNYFRSPWASMSVIAAIILLVLTFIQALCSIIAL